MLKRRLNDLWHRTVHWLKSRADQIVRLIHKAGVRLWLLGVLAIAIDLLGSALGKWAWDGPLYWTGLVSTWIGIIALAATASTIKNSAQRKLESTFSDGVRRATLGDLHSMVYVGSIYMTAGGNRHRPESVKTDLNEAELWFRRAAAQRSPRAFYWLARLYFKQGRVEEAKAALDAAAAAGDPVATHFLARCYLVGRYYERDPAKATALLEMAAERGNVVARGLLGRVLLRSRFGSGAWFKGLKFFVGAFVEAFIIAWKEGFASDRLR